MSEYIRYGKEWHNEVMKNKKETITHMLASVARERDVWKKIVDDVRMGNYNNANDISAAIVYIYEQIEAMKAEEHDENSI